MSSSCVPASDVLSVHCLYQVLVFARHVFQLCSSVGRALSALSVPGPGFRTTCLPAVFQRRTCSQYTVCTRSWFSHDMSSSCVPASDVLSVHCLYQVLVFARHVFQLCSSV